MKLTSISEFEPLFGHAAELIRSKQDSSFVVNDVLSSMLVISKTQSWGILGHKLFIIYSCHSVLLIVRGRFLPRKFPAIQ